ncbi:MAG: ABC transporter ATP-binding protein [Azospirillaceae bacterium]
MEHNIFGFIWRYSKPQQFVILLLTVCSLPFLYYSLDLPKMIVNDAIGGEGFPYSVLGIDLDQISYLLVLSGIFLALVVFNGGFKYYINVYKGRLGERMLRRLRYELYVRVLRFRLPRFKRMSQGEIIPMITSEVEPLGGFIGDAFATPAYQGGLLLTYLFFIFMQDPLLGAAAVSLYPIQGYIIPRLQRRVNQLGKQRVRNLRVVADRVGETVQGTQEIHAHDTSLYHMADIANRLATNYDIRYEIYRRKFFIKFLNNFLNQLTPFFFYAIGGILVIDGDISLGALVAVLAAYKDLASPWKELLTWYQMKEDVRIKYEQVIEQFQPPDLQPLEQLSEDGEIPSLPEEWRFANVTYAEDDSPPEIDNLTMRIPTRGHLAVVGDGGSGRDTLMLLLARLIRPTAGRIRFGEEDYQDLPERMTGRRIAYVGASTHMITGSLRDNMYYGLKHRPLRPPEYGHAEEALSRRRRAEALESGNTDLDINADWIDYAQAGVDTPEALEERALEVLALVDMSGDVYRMGLSGTLNPRHRTAAVIDKVLKARELVREKLAEPDYDGLVELWDIDAFNESATVAENLLFGTPLDATFDPDLIASNDYVREVLETAGLRETFFDIGRRVAATMVELFADLPPDHEFFEQYSFISAEELPDYQSLISRADKLGEEGLPEVDRARLTSLPFKLIPNRHRLGMIDEALKDKLLEARRIFRAELSEADRPKIAFFDVSEYNEAASTQDNILFGKIRYGASGAQDKVQTLLAQVIDAVDLRDTVTGVGLDRSVGVVGGRLSSLQRQKIALARALLRRPDVLLMVDATSALDGAAQARVHEAVLSEMSGRGLIWAPHRPGLVREFEDIIMLENGHLAGRGTFSELAMEEGSVLKRLLDDE